MNIFYDEKKKSYYVRLTLGYNNVGKRIQKKVTGKTKRDIHSKVRGWVKRFEAGEFDEVDRIETSLMFDEVVEEWMNEHVSELAVNTRNSYSARMNRILNKFGGRLVVDVTTRDIRVFLKSMQEDGLTPETTNTYRSILSSLFAYAVRNKYVNENPVGIIKQARMPKKEILTFDSLQLASYLEGCRQLAEEETNHGNYVALKTAAYTGMRIGEVLALRWSDIDFDNATIRVAHSLSYSTNDKRYSLDGTKNQRVRHVTISDELVRTLKWYKMQWLFLMQKVRNEPEPTFANLIFLTIEGKPKHRSYLRHWHKRVLRKKGLSERFRIHDLRHTHATLLLELGEHPKVVQERLGHKDISVTMDMYTHVTMTLQKQTAETFGALMDQNLSNE